MSCKLMKGLLSLPKQNLFTFIETKFKKSKMPFKVEDLIILIPTTKVKLRKPSSVPLIQHLAFVIDHYSLVHVHSFLCYLITHWQDFLTQPFC